MKLSKYFLLFTLFVAGYVKPVLAQLNIGDHYNPTTFYHVINFSSDHIDLRDYKGKLIILDFWGTGCSSCIDAFPHLDSLQKLYNGKLQIILVNQSTQDSTLRFFSKRKRIKLPAVPLITEDSLLSKSFFPHTGLPYHVWLDSNMKVIHTTEGYNLTPEHLNDYFNHKSLSLTERYFEPRDYSKPLICYKAGKYLNLVTNYSYLMHYSPSMDSEGGIFPDSNGVINHIAANASTSLQLLITAYEEGRKHDFYSKGLVELNVSDTTKYVWPVDRNKMDKWASENLYDYDLLVPESKANLLYHYMQQDLERYFNVTATIIKKNVSCFILVRTSAKDKLVTAGGNPTTNFTRTTVDSTKYIKNMTFEILDGMLSYLIRNHYGVPYVNETNYKGKIDFEVNKDDLETCNLEKIRSTLKKYDLDLISGKREKEVLLIQEDK